MQNLHAAMNSWETYRELTKYQGSLTQQEYESAQKSKMLPSEKIKQELLNCGVNPVAEYGQLR